MFVAHQISYANMLQLLSNSVKHCVSLFYGGNTVWLIFTKIFITQYLKNEFQKLSYLQKQSFCLSALMVVYICRWSGVHDVRLM